MSVIPNSIKKKQPSYQKSISGTGRHTGAKNKDDILCFPAHKTKHLPPKLTISACPKAVVASSLMEKGGNHL